MICQALYLKWIAQHLEESNNPARVFHKMLLIENFTISQKNSNQMNSQRNGNPVNLMNTAQNICKHGRDIQIFLSRI